MHSTEADQLCVTCAGRGEYDCDADALNRMPRMVSCWRCGGTGRQALCPICHVGLSAGRCGNARRHDHLGGE